MPMDWLGRLVDDFPDDDPADHAPLTQDDLRALELWHAFELVEDVKPAARISFRFEGSSTFIRVDPPPVINAGNGLAHLDAHLVARLGLHPRGRLARIWNRAERAVARRERRRQRRKEKHKRR